MARPCVCSLTPLTQCLSVSLSTQTFGQLSSPGRGSAYFLSPFWIRLPQANGEDPELSEGGTGTHSHTETTATAPVSWGTPTRPLTVPGT